MIKEWQIVVKSLGKFSTHFTETVSYLLGSEVTSNGIPHYAKKALNIIGCSRTRMLWFAVDFAPTPFTAFNVGGYSG